MVEVNHDEDLRAELLPPPSMTNENASAMEAEAEAVVEVRPLAVSSVDAAYPGEAENARSRSLLVASIASRGAAYQHGIRRHDLLLSVDGVPALDIGLAALSERREGGEWMFLHRRTEEDVAISGNDDGDSWERVAFETMYGCVGIEFKLSVPAAAQSLRHIKTWGCSFAPLCSGTPEDFEACWTLWENGCWEELAERTPNYDDPGCLDRAVLRCSTSGVGCQQFMQSYRITSRFNSPWRGGTFPFQALNAAARYEMGDRNAMNYLALYRTTDAQRYWTTDFMALVPYYTAKDLHSSGLLTSGGQEEVENAVVGLAHPATLKVAATFTEHPALEAYHYYPESRRVCTLTNELCGIDTSRAAARFLNTVTFFPDYELQPHWMNIEGVAAAGNLVASSQASSRSNAILLILMGDYRSNKPYSDLMKQWVHWYQAYHEDFGLDECHVLTTNSDKFNAFWPEGEEMARRTGVPTAVLHDADGMIHSQAEEAIGGEHGISFAPYSVLLRGRRVLMTAEDIEFNDATVLNVLSEESLTE